MKETEYAQMIANLRQKKGKASQPSQEAIDATWFSGNDFGLAWLLNTKGLWIYEKEVKARLATDKEREILQDAPFFIYMRREDNKTKTKKINEYLKGIIRCS